MKFTAQQSIDMAQGESLQSLYYVFPLISLVYYSFLEGGSSLVTRNGNKSITILGSNKTVFAGNFSYVGNKLNIQTLALSNISQYLGKLLLWKAKNLGITGDQYDAYKSVGSEATDQRNYALRGDDTIIGSAKSDTLFGGEGTDKLTGGKGVDKFAYSRIEESKSGKATRDVITDFMGSRGEKIDLSAIDAFASIDGDQAFAYIGASGFSGTQGEVRFSGGILQVNTGSDTTADMEIALTGVTSFQSSFLVL